jgi:hypothetical protein
MFSLQKWFCAKTEKELINEYLADSASLADLERRQRAIDLGDAPWQVRDKSKSRSFI